MSENDYHKSIAKAKSSIIIVWIVPLIALIIAGSMIAKYFIEKGEDIVIVFKSANGLSSGKTPLKYKGIRIGIVSDMKVNPQDSREFLVTVTVDNEAMPLVGKKGTKFWKVEPKVSVGEVSGLNTIISGSYIEMLPGVGEYSAIRKRDFFIAEKSKPIESYQEGIFITVRSHRGHLVEGTPLLYRKYAVGKVVKRQLKEGMFYYTVYIEDRYANLVKEKSHFWTLSGIELEASLSGIKLSMGPLSSIISGGIMFDSPTSSKALGKKKKVFDLSDAKEDRLLDPRTITLISEDEIELDPNLSRVYYRGVLAGKVLSSDFSPKEQKSKVVIELHEKYYALLKYKSHFWYVKPKITLNEISGLDALSKGSYIAFDTTDKRAKIVKNYPLYNRKPLTNGRYFSVQTDDLGSLSQGDPVYYKRMLAGEVTGYRYDKARDKVMIRLFINDAYADLINTSTSFYRQSGFDFEFSRDRLKFTTQAFDTVLRGGIGFIVNDKEAKVSKESKPFMLYENAYLANENNTFITLEMPRGYKLKSGSRVVYKDMKIGYVESLKFTQDHKVLAHLAIDKRFSKLLKSDTIFWIEDFKATVRGIKNSTAALFGPSIAIKPGTSMIKKEFFILSDKKPFFTVPKEGLRIMLKGSKKSSLRAGSPILYRQLKIGQVEHFDLAKDGTAVEIGLFIDKKYAYMVRKNSKFYHLSAIGMKVNLTGIKVMTETLESMIYGGIGMAVPDEAKEKAKEGDQFILELRADDDWFEWAPKLHP